MFPLPSDVLNDDAPRGPMQVVLFKPRGVSLGISLRRSPGVGEPLRISRIKEAGIADRCGALHVGDCIKSVNGQSLEGKSVQEAYKSLKFCDLQVQLDILPPRSQAEESECLRLVMYTSQCACGCGCVCVSVDMNVGVTTCTCSVQHLKTLSPQSLDYLLACHADLHRVSHKES